MSPEKSAVLGGGLESSRGTKDSSRSSASLSIGAVSEPGDARPGRSKGFRLGRAGARQIERTMRVPSSSEFLIV